MTRIQPRKAYTNLFGGKDAYRAYGSFKRGDGNTAVLKPGARKAGRIKTTLFGSKRTIILYRATIGEEGKMLTMLYRILQSTSDDLDATGMIMSYIITYFPTYYDRLIEALIQNSFFNVTEVTFPNSPLFIGHNEVAVENKQVLVAMLGIFLHIPFKNVTPENFSQFFSERAGAICSLVGLNPRTLPLPALGYIVKDSKRTMTFIGAYKRLVVQLMMDADQFDNEDLRKIMYYVVIMTQHTGMAAFFFVEKALVDTLSPILFYPELRSEVKAYCEAMEAVANVDHPAFFGITADAKDLHLIDRHRFPTLFAVSMQIMAQRYPSMRFFTVQENVNEERLKVLLKCHQRFMLHGGGSTRTDKSKGEESEEESDAESVEENA